MQQTTLAIALKEYRRAVEAWIFAIRAEECLISHDSSLSQIDTWQGAHFREGPTFYILRGDGKLLSTTKSCHSEIMKKPVKSAKARKVKKLTRSGLSRPAAQMEPATASGSGAEAPLLDPEISLVMAERSDAARKDGTKPNR